MYKKLLVTALPVVLFLALCVALYVWDAPIDYLTELTHQHTMVGYLAFVGLMFMATVFAPITVFPMVPALAPVFGPFMTGVLSIIGWTSGAVVAFLIARHFGRPLAQRFISLRAIDEAVERIPKDTRFFMIVLIRMTTPVDALSYALGFIRTISLWNYTIATVIGVSWFSFAFAYMGNAYLTSQWPLLLAVVAGSAVIFIGAWYILLRQYKKH